MRRSSRGWSRSWLYANISTRDSPGSVHSHRSVSRGTITWYQSRRIACNWDSSRQASHYYWKRCVHAGGWWQSDFWQEASSLPLLNDYGQFCIQPTNCWISVTDRYERIVPNCNYVLKVFLFYFQFLSFTRTIEIGVGCDQSVILLRTCPIRQPICFTLR